MCVLSLITVSALTLFLVRTQYSDTFNVLRRALFSKVTGKPAIILVTVDTLRADHLSCYGYPKNTSPNIDAFAQEALLFENCFSHAPVTSSSCASILSGFLPHETKVFGNLPLPTEVKTLPEILQQYGYKTAAVVSNYNLRRRAGWAQGFMIYDDTMNEREMVRRMPERTAEHTTRRAIEFLRQLHKDPLFMWIHYQDPHGPYTPPENFSALFQDPNQKPRNLQLNRTESGRGGIPTYQRLGSNSDFYYYLARYDGEIRYLDEQFKQLIESLKELAIYDDALIIFTADHGEGLGEHQYYFAHGEYLYNSLIHVPLIIKFGKGKTGRKIEYVQHIDIVPTIVNMLKLPVVSPFRGVDLRTANLKDRKIVGEMQSPRLKDGTRISIGFDGLKLIYTPASKHYELFNLKQDPHETNNLIDEISYQEEAKALKLKLINTLKEDLLKLNIVNKPLKLTVEERKKLRSLGYVQ